MKKVKLSFFDTDDNINISLRNSKFDSSLDVSINKPKGVTSSSTEILTLLSSAYEYISGTTSFAVTEVDANITAKLLDIERVSDNLKYKVD